MQPQDLIRDLKSELDDNFEAFILALMDKKAVFDAKCLRRAMKVWHPATYNVAKDIVAMQHGTPCRITH